MAVRTERTVLDAQLSAWLAERLPAATVQGSARLDSDALADTAADREAVALPLPYLKAPSHSSSEARSAAANPKRCDPKKRVRTGWLEIEWTRASKPRGIRIGTCSRATRCSAGCAALLPAAMQTSSPPGLRERLLVLRGHRLRWRLCTVYATLPRRCRRQPRVAGAGRAHVPRCRPTRAACRVACTLLLSLSRSSVQERYDFSVHATLGTRSLDTVATRQREGGVAGSHAPSPPSYTNRVGCKPSDEPVRGLASSCALPSPTAGCEGVPGTAR